MRDVESAPTEPARSETPDEIVTVEDYGAKIEIQIWHSTTPPTLRTTLTRTDASPDINETLPWVRDAQYYTLRRKEYLAGLGAISLHRAGKTHP